MDPYFESRVFGLDSIRLSFLSISYIRTNIYTLWWSDRSEHSRIINYIFLTTLRYKRIRGEWIGGNDREKWSWSSNEDFIG